MDNPVEAFRAELQQLFLLVRQPTYKPAATGYAHHHLGHHTEAISCYQHALALFRDVGDRYGETEILTHLGTPPPSAPSSTPTAVPAHRRCNPDRGAGRGVTVCTDA